MSQTAHLPPINLRSQKSENIQILVPLDDIHYESLVAALESDSQPSLSTSDTLTSSLGRNLSEISFSSSNILSRTLPFERMINSRIVPRMWMANLRPSKTAWEKAFDTISSPVGLYYMREFQLASIQAPQVLPISSGFPQPVQPEVPVVEPPVDTVPTEPPVDTVPTPTPTPTPVPAPTIFDIIEARGSINEESKAAIQKLQELIKKQDKVFRKLFQLLDNTYDRLFWRALLLAEPADKFVDQFTNGLSNGTPPYELIAEIGLDFGLKKTEMDRWTTVAKAVGEAV
jgi:hypothetical protein